MWAKGVGGCNLLRLVSDITFGEDWGEDLHSAAQTIGRELVIEADLWQAGTSHLSQITLFHANVYMQWNGHSCRIIKPVIGIGYTTTSGASWSG